MPCTEAYKEHIEYTFNAFCRVVIHYAAINAWRDRDKRRQREISFEYLTEEKFYPFCTSDTYFIAIPFSAPSPGSSSYTNTASDRSTSSPFKILSIAARET